MPRRNNSEEPSRGRKGSSSRSSSGNNRTTGARGSFKKSSSGDTGKSFGKKTAGGGRSESKAFGKPFKKFDKDSPKPFRKRSDEDGEKPRSSSSRSEKFSRPFKKFDKEDKGKSFRKRSDEGGEEKRRPFSAKSENRASPYKKSYGKDSGKRFSKPSDEGGEERRRPFSGRSENQSRPYKKPYGKDSGKRFSKPSDEGGEERRRPFSGRSENQSRPYKKPFGKDSAKPFSKSRDEGGEERKRPFSNRSENPSRPFKKTYGKDSGKPFSKSRDEGGEERKRPFSGKPENRSRPYKKTYGKDPSKSFSKPADLSGTPERKGGSRKRTESSEDPAALQTEKVRLNKYISNSGVCSRREADELITMGLISVNGKTITELGYKVDPGDEVRYESKVLKAEKPVYILLNKPKGYLTTTVDPQERNTVMQIIGTAVKERIYPVGRLDRNTTGLLLLTNDGDLADKLMHPSYNVKKIYKVELDRPLTKADFQKISEGIQLEEGRAMVDDLAIVSDDGKTIGVELHIGWNRVVRRIFESLEYTVIKLDRSVYAGLDKKDLGRGEWRFLRKEEIVRLKHYK